MCYHIIDEENSSKINDYLTGDIDVIDNFCELFY